MDKPKPLDDLLLQEGDIIQFTRRIPLIKSDDSLAYSELGRKRKIRGNFVVESAEKEHSPSIDMYPRDSREYHGYLIKTRRLDNMAYNRNNVCIKFYFGSPGQLPKIKPSEFKVIGKMERTYKLVS